MTYVCQSIDELSGSCVEWVEQSNFITELSSLTHAQAGELLTLTALLFSLAWLFKMLSLTARRG